MKIGVVGLGVVGQAITDGFEYLEHEVFVHDTKFNDSDIINVLEKEVCFLCVPVPRCVFPLAPCSRWGICSLVLVPHIGFALDTFLWWSIFHSHLILSYFAKRKAPIR